MFEDLAADGNQLIFGTSFGYMDPMLAAAENYPDVAFMHATGYKTSDNMGNYFGAAEEGRYLSGMAAGERTESGLIGYVAAFPIPEVLRGINAFTLGVREINPEADVQVVWTSTWFDPTEEGDAAQALLDSGVDVIAMHQDTSAPGQAAEAAGAGWVGYNTDMSEFAPERLAHRRHLGLGSVLPGHCRSGEGRYVGAGGVLRQHGRRHGRHRTVRSVGLRGDAGADRDAGSRRSSTGHSSCFPIRS